jgi:pyruvate ferredoxin oxidoreductase beta subunit
VLIIAGDGATYDIGLQALSGAVERGHDFVYLCLDNEGYMNTGYQKSSATPLGASTSTTPSGKPTPRKDLMQILVAHGIPYAAQGSPHAWADLTAKATEAFATPGPAFLNVLAPCPTNWKSAPAAGLALLAAAADTCAWPLYEVVNGKYTVNNRPQVKKPLAAYLAGQKRFASLLKPENAQLLAAAEAEVEASWQNLLAKATKA